jgi:manganese efflux pump family protein
MEFFAVFFLAVGLAMDCFAVSLGIGTSEHIHGLRPALRLAFHFGLFQAMMPVIGWLAGRSVEPLISGFDHWLALALLSLVGVRMIRSGLSNEEVGTLSVDPSRGRTLVMLSVATSIDALAVGLSLAALKVDIIYPSVVIGVVTLALSLLALRLGRTLGERLGNRMEIVGGLILIAIGVRVVLSHLL